MIKLFHAATSPYVRKVMVCAHEAGCIDEIALLSSAAHPVDRDERIATANPLAKIPAAITETGLKLFDSRVICEYLASRFACPTLFPHGAARWQALAHQALGDGLLDAALLARYERMARPLEYQWQPWYDGQLKKIDASLDAIEVAAPELAIETPDIGSITLGCALGYLDFRFADLGWRTGRPQACAWFEAFSLLPAMQATQPPAA